MSDRTGGLLWAAFAAGFGGLALAGLPVVGGTVAGLPAWAVLAGASMFGTTLAAGAAALAGWPTGAVATGPRAPAAAGPDGGRNRDDGEAPDWGPEGSP